MWSYLLFNLVLNVALISSTAISINDADDFNNRLTEAGSKLVAVVFDDKWCGPPCKEMNNSVDEISSEFSNADFLKVDLEMESNKEITLWYNIQALPVILLLKNSLKVDRVNEFLTRDQIKALITANY